MSLKSTSTKKVSAIAVLALILLFLAVAKLFWKHISFSATNSVGYHVFYVVYDPKHIKRGDYVIFTINPQKIKVKEVRNELKKFNTHRLVKQVACMPNDNLTVKGYSFYCNGKYLCKAKKKALDGEKLTRFVYNGKVPEGFVFVMGKDRNSFDSRYFGFVSLRRIVGIAYPIF